MEKVKFLKKGIKVNGAYHAVRYSTGPYTKESGLPESTITIYVKGYESIPECGLEIKNDTDSQQDYFCKDKIRIRPDHPMYNEALKIVA
jgi:hypothetical protein